MQVVHTIEEMRSIAMASKCQGKRVGVVPTMGFLHEGHMSLIRRIRGECDLLVVTIFVNPTQFAPGEDLDQYPRDMDRDKSLCESESTDIVFAPSPEAMYDRESSVYIDEGALSKGLCGTNRDGHFRGVLTVVAKLFNIVQPDIAVFGMKDAQQARLIQQMVSDLNFPVDIVLAPIVRESDGLAMSSRNSYLSDDERGRALCLRESLLLAEELYKQNETDTAAIRSQMKRLIESSGGEVEYIEIVDYETLKPTETISSRTLVAVAVSIGSTRLIDNIILIRA